MGYVEELVNFTHAKVTFNEHMKKHTGYGVGGKARFFILVDSLYTLNQVLELSKKHKIKYKIIGNGTNILFSDKDFDGAIISLKKIDDVFFKCDLVKAMAGAKLEKLISFSLENGLSGSEALVGIPASVGGAICMNVGAFGTTISDFIETVEIIKDGKIKIFDKNQCDFSYRASRFLRGDQPIVSATFSFIKGDRNKIRERINSYLDLRRSIQPAGRSCGSVFKNPNHVSAGELIDRANLKGLSIGHAKVSNKHGNFIITEKGAKAKDVYNLIQTVKYKVKSEFNVELIEEIEYVGDFDDFN